MNPQELKTWIEDCIRTAKSKGMSDEEILIELMEQVRIMLVREAIKICDKRK